MSNLPVSSDASASGNRRPAPRPTADGHGCRRWPHLLVMLLGAMVITLAPATAAEPPEFDPLDVTMPEQPGEAPTLPPEHPEVAEELPDEVEPTRPTRSLPVMRRSASRLMADQWATLAGQARVLPRPGQPYQAGTVAPLLDMAIEYSSRDAQLWYQRALLADPLEQPELLRQALERYCQIEPEDDAARLRLIELEMDGHQSIDQRMAHVKALLEDEDSAPLTDALKSRLHTFLAGAALELGDDNTHRRHLLQAVRLDKANKDAAMMVHDWVRQRNGSPLHQGVALWGVIYADPFAPEPRRHIADLLLSMGAYEAAERQYEVSNSLRQRMPSAGTIQRWAHAAAAAGQLDTALELVAEYQAYLWQDRGEGGPADGGGAEAARLLPHGIQMIRAMVLWHDDRPDELDAAFHHLVRGAGRNNPEQSEAERAWLRIMFDRVAGDDEGDQALRAMIDAHGDDHPAVRRAAGWLAWRRGAFGEARAELEEVAGEDPLAAYALAMIARAQRRPQDEITRLLQHAITADPMSDGALLSAMQLDRMNVNIARSAEARHLANIPLSWPGAIRRPGRGADRLVEFSLRVEPEGTIRFLDPVTAVLRLRNNTSVPLSLSEGVLPETVVLRTEVRHTGQRMPAMPLQVVGLGRRLTLQPGEAVEVPVRLDHGPLGEIMSHEPWRSVNFSVTATLDPYQDQRGVIRPGPMGHEARVFVRERRPMVSDNELNTQAMRALDRDDSGQRMLALSVLGTFVRRAVDAIDHLERSRQRAVQQRASVEEVEQLEDLAEALGEELGRVAGFLNERFTGLETREQAWLVRFTAPVVLRPAPGPLRWRWVALDDAHFRPVAPIAHAAAESDEPMVRMMFLATWITDPQAAELVNATDDPDPRVAAFAQARMEALADLADLQRQMQQGAR